MRTIWIVALALAISSAPLAAQQAEPDYAAWNALLNKYYDPARGMDYAHLKAADAATLASLRATLGKVNAASLNGKQRLAYWINVYNINVVSTIVEKYPTKSIRDLSTDPIIRLNVFKKERVRTPAGLISLNDVENDRVREAFHDPRIHFAINCAARGCPPIRTEAYVGARVDAQLDDQARKFLNGPNGVRVELKGQTALVHVTKIADWFGKDFEQWGGGKVVFLRRFLAADKLSVLSRATKAEFDYDDYNWDLNDWRR